MWTEEIARALLLTALNQRLRGYAEALSLVCEPKEVDLYCTKDWGTTVNPYIRIPRMGHVPRTVLDMWAAAAQDAGIPNDIAQAAVTALCEQLTSTEEL